MTRCVRIRNEGPRSGITSSLYRQSSDRTKTLHTAPEKGASFFTEHPPKIRSENAPLPYIQVNRSKGRQAPAVTPIFRIVTRQKSCTILPVQNMATGNFSGCFVGMVRQSGNDRKRGTDYDD